METTRTDGHDPLLRSYLAGYIDGDGSIDGRIERTTTGRNFKLKLTVTIFQKKSKR